MNGKQLKNSILQWAIQGKLVPQDPNDEPASVLLERIRAEKARLVKEGKIKKDKNESIIYRGDDNSHYEKFADGTVRCIDDEIPFDVPNRWIWCRIKHVFSMQAGKSITANEIQDEQIGNYIYPCFGGNGLRGYVKRHNKEGLFVLVGRQGALCGNVQMANGFFYATEHAVVTDGFGLSDIKWAYYFLTALNLNQYATATAQPGLAVSNIAEVPIPLPPLSEQKRIVERLDELWPIIDVYELAQAKLDKLNNAIKPLLRKSVLNEAIKGWPTLPIVQKECHDNNDEPAFKLLERIKDERKQLVKQGRLKAKDLVDSNIFKCDDNKYYEQINGKYLEISDEIPFDIPGYWAWCRLGDLFSHNNGKQLNKGNSKGIRMNYITTSNLYWDGFVLENLKQMPFEESEIDRCKAIKGDLLVCEGGDVGRSCIWNYDYPIMLQNHIHKLRPYLSLCVKYFYYVMYYYNLTARIGGKGIGIKGLSSKALHNTMIPLPPLKEQYRISEKVDEALNYLQKN